MTALPKQVTNRSTIALVTYKCFYDVCCGSATQRANRPGAFWGTAACRDDDVLVRLTTWKAS